MKSLPRGLSLVLLAFAPAVWAALPPGAAPAPRAPAVEDPDGPRVIVKYRALGQLMHADRATRAAARSTGPRGPQHAAAMSLRTGQPLRDGRVIDGQMQVLRGTTAITAAALAERLAADPEVEYAVPDGRRHALALPNDPLYAGGAGVSPAAGQWYLRAPDATLVAAINAAGAWDVTPGSASIVVADLDTGVLPGHPDLAAKLLPGYDFITASATAADGGGRDADATDPGDWTTAGECGAGVAATASSWHGTQTAGLIGAHTDNGVGMASVGRRAMLLPVRVLGKCGGSDSDIIAAMLWAGGLSSTLTVNPNPARVINLSLGGSGSCSAAYLDAVNRLVAAGVVVVAAAGNDEGLAVSSPANCAGVIAVGGVRHTGTKVGYSSLGPQVALAAPAGNCVNTAGSCVYPILTTTNAGTQTATTHGYSDGANYSVGTSFSAPLVSGTVALMLSANPALTPAAVKSLLQSTARAFPATAAAGVPQCRAPTAVAQDECLCTTSTCGAGLLDAAGAVTAAAAAAAASIPDPTAAIATTAGSVQAGATVVLDGSASAAAGGRSIAAWRWTITAGSGIAAFDGATDGATARLVTHGAGSFTVQLTVTDSAGRQGSTTATVVVGAAAAPVVALLASAQAVGAGTPVTFDGSGSAAATGLSIVSWQWSITSGAGLASFSSATGGPTATVATAGNGSGSFTVRLTVTDSLGQQSSSTLTVDVVAVTPLASVGTPAATVTAGATVVFDAAGSTAPAGRTIAGYQWAVTSGSAIAALSGSTTGSTATVVTSGAGSFTVRLTVTDSAGAQDSRTATVAVESAPVATVSSSAGGGGGGGATGPMGVAALALAAAALRRREARGMPR